MIVRASGVCPPARRPLHADGRSLRQTGLNIYIRWLDLSDRHVRSRLILSPSHTSTMPGTFEYDFSTTGGEFKGKSSFSTGLFINGEFVDAKSGKTIDVINPVNGEVVGKVSAGDKEDVDIAVKAAEKAHQTVWGGKFLSLVLATLSNILSRKRLWSGARQDPHQQISVGSAIFPIQTRRTLSKHS